MEARTKTVEGWLSMIGQGLLALPRFQRHEAWKADQIEGVVENILRVSSLPIGALLTLEVGDEELFHSRPIVSAPPLNGRPQMHLLDGQQRMTAIWRSLHDSYEELSIFVELGDSDDEPGVEIKKRWERNGVRYPVWLDSPQQVLAAKLIPVHILCPGSKPSSPAASRPAPRFDWTAHQPTSADGPVRDRDWLPLNRRARLRRVESGLAGFR